MEQIAKWVIQYESYLHSQQVIRVFCSILVPEYHPAVLIGDESFVELLPTAYFLCKTETKNEFIRRLSVFPRGSNVLLGVCSNANHLKVFSPHRKCRVFQVQWIVQMRPLEYILRPTNRWKYFQSLSFWFYELKGHCHWNIGKYRWQCPNH